MASALKNKVLKLEAKLPREKPCYQFAVNVLVPDEISETDLTDLRMSDPLKTFTRVSDQLRTERLNRYS